MVERSSGAESTAGERGSQPRRATEADVAALSALGRRTFLATFVEEFGVPYPKDDLERHLEASYGLEATARLIADPALFVRVVDASCGAEDRALCAYVVAGPCQLPHAEASERQGELRRLYVDHAQHGHGHGRRLLDQALHWLEQTFHGPLWVGVWSGNHKAQELYRRRGFEKVGEYAYPVGAWNDHEFIFRRPTPSSSR